MNNLVDQGVVGRSLRAQTVQPSAVRTDGVVGPVTGRMGSTDHGGRTRPKQSLDWGAASRRDIFDPLCARLARSPTPDKDKEGWPVRETEGLHPGWRPRPGAVAMWTCSP
jgi:hypothetical protein